MTAFKPMSADEFLAWAMKQPEGQRHELAAGEIVAMAPERAEHARVKGNVHVALRQAIQAANLSCEPFVNSLAVRIDATTIYEPDVMLRCGPPIDRRAIEINAPMILVEVVSPSSRKRDTGAKLDDYFRLESVRHYLIIKTENKAIIHHRRDDAGAIATTVIRDGVVRLAPPGIELSGVFVGL